MITNATDRLPLRVRASDLAGRRPQRIESMVDGDYFCFLRLGNHEVYRFEAGRGVNVLWPIMTDGKTDGMMYSDSFPISEVVVLPNQLAEELLTGVTIV